MSVIAPLLAGARELLAAFREVFQVPPGEEELVRLVPPEWVAPATAPMARTNAAYDPLSGRGLHRPA
jgi:hypothetical protein